MPEAWFSRVPELASVSDRVWLHEASGVQIIRAKPGDVLFCEGDVCRNWVLVLSGCVRVQKTDADGREILLYRVGKGQECLLTTVGLMGGQEYSADGLAESEAEIIALPAASFRRALAGSEGFREFVMRGIGCQVSDLMALIEDVAFGRLDQRVARLLCGRSGGEGELKMTHQQIAAELGTAREVVSRVLKTLERKGLVELGRGRISITDFPGLAHLCDNITDNRKT